MLSVLLLVKVSKSCILCGILNSLMPGINITLCKVCTYKNRWGWLKGGLLFSPLTPNTVVWFTSSNVGVVVFVCVKILITIISPVWYFLSVLIHLIRASGPPTSLWPFKWDLKSSGVTIFLSGLLRDSVLQHCVC